MTKGIDKIIRDCLEEMNAPLPRACHRTKACRMAGGCVKCYSGLIADARSRRTVAREWFEDHRDREEDLRMFGTSKGKVTIQ
jgi:hypothetical protein